jgi:hypothetical protein
MDTWVWIVIVVAVVVVVALVVAAMLAKRRRAHLQDRFGPEYDHTVEDAKNRRSAEHELREREQRHDDLDLHALPPQSRDRYQHEWTELQSRFVDRPQVAVADADALIGQVMRDIGYPVESFESNADLISVSHPNVVSRYREGHAIYTKTVEGSATTEDLRRGVIAYRSLFDELMRDDAEASQS